jgi:PadR family transcriptional regulator, regulatory protein PadR
MNNLEDPAYWKALVNMGLSKFFILRVLHTEASHGYAVLEKLARFTEGCCVPTYGTIYPILKEFVEGEYASVSTETVDGRQRKVYQLTEKGEGAYRNAVRVWQDMVPYIARVVGENGGDAHD